MLGHWEFFGLDFTVSPDVLIPRDDTLAVTELAIERLQGREGPLRVLDLCTGSGCIAIACAMAFPEAYVDAVDISPEALAVSGINIVKHDLGGQVQAVCSDLFSAVEGKHYDLIVSNPPYVNSEEWHSLPPEYHAEPKIGLESGCTGLDCVRRILADAEKHLKPGGLLVVEVGSSAEALEHAYPKVPFCWIDFERGGDGVFVFTADQLAQYRDHFQK